MKSVQALRTIILLSLFIFYSFATTRVQAVDEPTKCSGQVIDLGFPKKLLSFDNLSRPGTCGVKPTKIVMHTTWGIEGADDLWTYFEEHPEGRYASTQFTVGKDGKILQMLELLSDKAEIGWAVSYFNDDSISIEIGKYGDFNSRDEVPKVQYDATVKLVQALMKAYNIPVGNIEFSSINNNNNPASGGPISKSSEGIFGHYQLSPDDRSDPGQGFLRDFREDMKKAGPAGEIGTGTGGTGSSTATSQKCITKVGSPTEPSPGPLGCTGGSGTGGGGLPGACQAAPAVNFTTAQQYADAISQKWGITFTDMALDQMQMIWEEFHQIDCVGFLQDIKGTVVAGWDGEYSQQLSCPQDIGIDVQFGNHHGDFVKALITHELTHVWQKCAQRGEANLLDIPAAYSAEGGLTNYSRTGCGYGVNLHNEDHADTIALYLNPTNGELTCGNGAPNPFAGGEYPLHKGVAEKGLGK